MTRWPPSVGGCRAQAVEKEYEFEWVRGKRACSTCSRSPSADRLPRRLRARRGRLVRACLRRLLHGGRPGRPRRPSERPRRRAVFVSRDRRRTSRALRRGWAGRCPWYTLTDGFDSDFGVDEWLGTNAGIRTGDRVFRTYFIDIRGDEVMGRHLGLPRYRRRLGAGGVGRRAGGLPPFPPYSWWTWHRRIRRSPSRPRNSAQIDPGMSRRLVTPRAVPPIDQDGRMRRSAAEIVREYGPFPGVDHVHGVTYDGQRVWFAAETS